MNPDSLRTVTPTMADAIDQRVLTVGPQTPLTEVIYQMTSVWGGCMVAPEKGETLPADVLGATTQRPLSCALVVDQSAVVGIFTERDIVKLTAASYNFDLLTVGEVMTAPVKTLQISAFQDIFAVLFLFRRYRIRHLPIVNEQDQLMGVVTPESIRKVLRPANLLKMRRVADVMTQPVLHAPLDSSVIELANLMAEHRVSCVVIARVDSQQTDLRQLQAVTPMGIVTERDIVQFQALQLNLKRLKAKDIMSSPLFLLSPEDSLWAAHEEMKRRRVRRLVVSWNWGGSLGLVTQTSLLKVFDPIEMYGIIETMQRTMHQLQVGPESDVPASVSDPSETHGRPMPLKAAPVNRPFAVCQDGLISQSDSSQPDPSGFSTLASPLQNSQTSEQVDVSDLLLDIEARLISLATNPDISEQQRQAFINSALASIQQIQAVLQVESLG